MLLHDLAITVTFTDKNEAPLLKEALFKIPANLKFFDGHFPGNPILPAFASLEISVALGQELGWLPQKIQKIPNAKFLAAVKPEENIKVLMRKYEDSLDFEWQVQQDAEWKKACEISISL